jgi:hypothetical protein
VPLKQVDLPYAAQGFFSTLCIRLLSKFEGGYFLKRLVILSVVGIGFLLSGCYSGPGMGKVMRETCDGITSFEKYYYCVKRNWHDGVVTAGYGSNTDVQYAMDSGYHLLEGVQAGVLTDSEAKYKWREVQLDLHRAEQERNARTAAAIGQALQNYSTAVSQSQTSTYASPSISGGLSCRTVGQNTRCSDGTTYRTIGNSIRGSDGTYCRKTGQTLRCY